MKLINDSFTEGKRDIINMIAGLSLAILLGGFATYGIPTFCPDIPSWLTVALAMGSGCLAAGLQVCDVYGKLLESILFRKERKHNAKVRYYDSIISFAFNCKK